MHTYSIYVFYIILCFSVAFSNIVSVIYLSFFIPLDYPLLFPELKPLSPPHHKAHVLLFNPLELHHPQTLPCPLFIFLASVIILDYRQ